MLYTVTTLDQASLHCVTEEFLSTHFKTSAILISNNAEGRSEFLLKNRGSGYNIKKLEHASQDFSFIDL
jgi:hypothetical protein